MLLAIKLLRFLFNELCTISQWFSHPCPVRLIVCKIQLVVFTCFCSCVMSFFKLVRLVCGILLSFLFQFARFL